MNKQPCTAYDLIIKANDNEFPYDSLEKEDIQLKRHEELAQGKYTQPLLSEDAKYIGVLCKGREEDLVYIFITSNLARPLYEYNGMIHSFSFTTVNSGLIIVYADKIVYFKLSLGHMVRGFKTNDEPIPKPIFTLSAPGGRYFIIGSLSHFTIWDIVNGNETSKIVDDSIKKFCSQTLLLGVTAEGEIRIIKIQSGAVLKKFRLKGINSSNEILHCMLSEYLEQFFYLTPKGFFCFIFQTEIINCVVRFDADSNYFVPIEGYISPDCQYYIATNKEEIVIWEEEANEEPRKIYRERFRDFYIDFDLSVLLIVDVVELYILKYSNDNPQELSVLLRRNPTKFDSFKFSPEGSALLTIISEYNAILWNCETGTILKEWYREIEQWSRSVEMVPDTSLLAVIATKSSDNCIKLWDYSKGKEVMSLYSFNCYSMCFSPEGNLLSAGSKYGYEIARLWNITEGSFNSYYNFNYPNINAVVAITGKEVNYLIAHAVNQNPLLFDIESMKLLYSFKCPYTFTKLESIITARDCSLFVSTGYDAKKERIAFCLSIEDGSVVKPLEACSSIEFSRDGRFLLTKRAERGSTEIKQKTLEISGVHSQLTELTSDITAPNESRFFQDSISQINVFANEEASSADILLTNIKSGEIFAAISYVNKTKQYARYEITHDSDNNSIIFRHISLET